MADGFARKTLDQVLAGTDTQPGAALATQTNEAAGMDGNAWAGYDGQGDYDYQRAYGQEASEMEGGSNTDAPSTPYRGQPDGAFVTGRGPQAPMTPGGQLLTDENGHPLV